MRGRWDGSCGFVDLNPCGTCVMWPMTVGVESSGQ